MNSTIVRALLASFCLGCVFSAVTHMPPLEEITLAPDLILAMSREETTDAGCNASISHSMRNLICILATLNAGSAYSPYIRRVTPCEKCRTNIKDLRKFYITDVATYEYNDEISDLQSLSFGIPVVHTQCVKCHLTDDNGVEYVGEIDATFGNPQVNIISFWTGLNDLTIALVNITSVDERKVSCKGAEKFHDICNRVHQTGELDRVLHASIETLFKANPDNFEGVPAKDIQGLRGWIEDLFLC